jgi:hypothetical protein
MDATIMLRFGCALPFATGSHDNEVQKDFNRNQIAATQLDTATAKYRKTGALACSRLSMFFIYRSMQGPATAKAGCKPALRWQCQDMPVCGGDAIEPRTPVA